MINDQPLLKVTNEEKAVISELRQQVAGKQGKFIKVSGGRSNNNKHERGKKHKSEKPASHWAQSQSPLTGDYFPSQPTPSPGEPGRSQVTERKRNKTNQGGVETSGGHPGHHRQSRSKSLDVLQHRQPPPARERRPRGSNLDISDLSDDEMFLREQKPQQSRSRSRQRGVRECNGWYINNQHQPHQTPQNNSR